MRNGNLWKSGSEKSQKELLEADNGTKEKKKIILAVKWKKMNKKLNSVFLIN